MWVRLLTLAWEIPGDLWKMLLCQCVNGVLSHGVSGAGAGDAPGLPLPARCDGSPGSQAGRMTPGDPSLRRAQPWPLAARPMSLAWGSGCQLLDCLCLPLTPASHNGGQQCGEGGSSCLGWKRGLMREGWDWHTWGAGSTLGGRLKGGGRLGS